MNFKVFKKLFLVSTVTERAACVAYEVQPNLGVIVDAIKVPISSWLRQNFPQQQVAGSLRSPKWVRPTLPTRPPADEIALLQESMNQDGGIQKGIRAEGGFSVN